MQRKYNSNNVRLIYNFIEHLRDSEQLSEATITGAKRALKKYQIYTRYADFITFSKEQVKGFKEFILKQKLSKSTLLHFVNDMRRFFDWLRLEKGYSKKIDPRDLSYFKLSRKDMKEIKSETYKPFATFEQMQKVIHAMPSETLIQRRDRALMSLAFMTGARDKALSTAKIRHINLNETPPSFMQESKTMDTKDSKYIHTFFVMAVGEKIYDYFINYYRELTETLYYGNDDPLFPKTKLGQDHNLNFIAAGLTKDLWANAEPIRKIFKKAFHAVGLDYYPPHRIRKTLTQFAEKHCKTPEEFKAFSQNIGHDNPLTTFTSYGKISHHRQGELIGKLGYNISENNNLSDSKLDKVLALLQNQS